MAKFSLSQEVASKVEERFPTHTVTFDGDAFDESIDVTFRNYVALSKDERREFTTAQAAVQRDIQAMIDEAKALDAAVEAGDADAKARAKFEKKALDFDTIEMKRALQVKQLAILAADRDAAEAALALCDARQVEVVSALIAGNDEVAGLATGE